MYGFTFVDAFDGCLMIHMKNILSLSQMVRGVEASPSPSPEMPSPFW